MDDRDLDSAAFDSMFRAWYPRLVRYAEAMLHERAVAEEVAQDVMLAIWQSRGKLSITGSVGGYLFRATRNRVLNELRHRKIQQKSLPYLGSPAEAPADAEDRLQDEEIRQALHAALSELPDRCREVFELSRVQGLRYAEIAEAMDISVKTVETQMGKALKHLRERLGDLLGD
jgi:RNA polymerase sigma-70 factor (ECF subfamily)